MAATLEELDAALEPGAEAAHLSAADIGARSELKLFEVEAGE